MDWSQKRCVVLDMDGTVYLGHLPIAGAVRFIRQHWNKLDFYFLSNNTSKSPVTYVDKLNGMAGCRAEVWVPVAHIWIMPLRVAAM